MKKEIKLFIAGWVFVALGFLLGYITESFLPLFIFLIGVLFFIALGVIYLWRFFHPLMFFPFTRGFQKKREQ